MTDWEQFEQDLQEALARLYDPAFEPSQGLRRMLGGSADPNVAAVQSAVVREIEGLAPTPDTPVGARPRQVYDVLHSRFVLKLTQEGAAEHLHMSVSTVKRAQREATHVLARRLWERATDGSPSMPAPSSSISAEPSQSAGDLQAADWQAQARRELAALEAGAPGAVADVAEVLREVLELEDTVMPENDPRARIGFVQPNLIAAVHPALLRQMLMGALRWIAAQQSIGQVLIYGGLEDGRVRITIIRPLSPGEEPDLQAFTADDVLVPRGGSVHSGLDGGRLAIWVELPSVGRTTVLVVDDNTDMARFYRRATAGTRYHIVHVARGADVDDAIASSAPNVIVLDVMLPDADGWRLLMRLRTDPETHSIPVIVASVVREENLAYSLGAAAYITKPVRARQFIEALDLVQAAGDDRPTPETGP